MYFSHMKLAGAQVIYARLIWIQAEGRVLVCFTDISSFFGPAASEACCSQGPRRSTREQDHLHHSTAFCLLISHWPK